jgi:hypothetical protein
VGLQIAFDRPIATFVVNAANGRPPALSPRPELPFGPLPLGRVPGTAVERVIDEAHLIEKAGLLTKVLLSDALSAATLVVDIDNLVTTDVRAWSPSLCTTSSAELVEALTTADDTLADVSITICALDVTDSTAYVEWRLVGRFSNPCLLDDDLLVEQTGCSVESSGVLVIRFVDDRAADIHCYYDDLALLEQILTML